MSLCEDDLHLTWIIENYSFRDERENRVELYSPFFTSSNIDEDVWLIGFPFKTDDDKPDVYFRLTLVRVMSKDSIKKKKYVSIELCNGDNEVITSLDKTNAEVSEKEREEKELKAETYKLAPLKTKELDKIMKKSHTDTLIIRCRISTGNCPTDIKRKKINSTAKTTIAISKYSFNWNVNFDKPSNTLKKAVIIGKDVLESEIIVEVSEDDVSIEIRIEKNDQDFRVKCEISLLDSDKTEVLSGCDYLFHDHKSLEEAILRFPMFFKRSFLVDRNLHNRCTLRFDFSVSDFSLVHEYIEVAEEPCPGSFFQISKKPVMASLQDDLSAMLLNDKYADVKLKVGKEVIHAHKLILASRSPVFSVMFDQDMTESKTGEVDVSDMSADTMKLFLKFLYTELLDEVDSPQMVELLLAAEKYQVLSLKEKCSEFLALHLDTDNICDVASVADMVGHAALKTAAINFINERSVEILGLPKWPKWIERNVKLGSEILCKLSENIRKAK